MRTFSSLAVALALATGANAQTVKWCFQATGAEEVPPVNTNATADAVVTLDQATNELSWNISHQGLTGTHSASHFHGPAGVGQNGGVQVNIGTGNPVVGSQFITGAQAAMFLNGDIYLNLHTSAFPAGEIRGQVDDVCDQLLCTSLANSFSAGGARMVVAGDFSAASNAMTFTGTGVPPGQFGILLLGHGSTQVTPPGSAGLLCIAGGTIGRFNGQILVANGSGVLGPFTPDLLNLPSPPGGSVVPGDNWNFQIWFRDVGNTSNFADARSVTFH